MPGDQNDASVRLMTYNIHCWAGRDGRLDLDRLAEVIRVSGADVIGLNEVVHPVTVGRRTYAPLAELAEKLGMVYAFGPSGWEEGRFYGRGPLGNALLSRYPLAEVRNTLLPRWPSTKQRSLLGATLAGGPVEGLMAYVTHLDHAFEGTRLHQIQGVLQRIRHETHHAPHFLVGDFNTPGFLGPHMRRLLPPVLRMMRRAGYADAFHTVGEGQGFTFPAQSPLVRIDFLFMPLRWAQGLRVAHALAHHPTSHASDHRPLVVDWVWPQLAAA